MPFLVLKLRKPAPFQFRAFAARRPSGENIVGQNHKLPARNPASPSEDPCPEILPTFPPAYNSLPGKCRRGSHQRMLLLPQTRQRPSRLGASQQLKADNLKNCGFTVCDWVHNLLRAETSGKQYGVGVIIKVSVARTGIEPATLALLAPRSNQLS